MILNHLEYLLMNNPVRAFVQKHIEAERLVKMGGSTKDKTALEIGCGRGIGIEIILNTFEASCVDAFDLDPRMIALANQRNKKYMDKVRIWQGDATTIQAANNQYDAVFDFGIVHHIPQWREALTEVYRVLKPGGRFYAEEVFSRLINHWLWRRLFLHPQEDRFNCEQFCAAMENAGFGNIKSHQIWGSFGWFTAIKPLSY